MLTGWLTRKSVVSVVLHDAATSSHSLVVALSRRRDVVIIGFRSSSGLPTRLLGALDSDSTGHADSALRYSPKPADRIELVSESSSVDDSGRRETFTFLGEGEEEEDREAEGGGGTRTRTQPPPEDTTALESADERFSLEFFLLRASGEVTTPTSLEAALEASESLWVTPGLAELLLGEEEEASPKLRATLGSWATTDPAACAEAAAAAAAVPA